MLLHAFNEDPRDSPADTQMVGELCKRVMAGECGQLDVREIEQEYDAQWGAQDTDESIRAQIAAEGVVRCMQNGSESLRRWVLHESVQVLIAAPAFVLCFKVEPGFDQNYWTRVSGSSSPLCERIMARRLSAFLQASLSLLRVDTVQVHRQVLDSDCTVIIRLLQHALPELELLPVPKHMNDSRALVIELMMELLSIDAQRQKQQVIDLVCLWCDDVNGWKESLETGVRLFVSRSSCCVVSGILCLA